MGITDMNRVYRAADLAGGKQIVFAATGVTDGTLMKGVRFFGEGTRTSSPGHADQPASRPVHRHRASARGLGRQGSILAARGETPASYRDEAG